MLECQCGTIDETVKFTEYRRFSGNLCQECRNECDYWSSADRDPRE